MSRIDPVSQASFENGMAGDQFSAMAITIALSASTCPGARVRVPTWPKSEHIRGQFSRFFSSLIHHAAGFYPTDCGRLTVSVRTCFQSRISPVRRTAVSSDRRRRVHPFSRQRAVVGAAGLLRRQRQSQDDPRSIPLLNPVAIPEKTPGIRHVLSCLSDPRHTVSPWGACCTPGQVIEQNSESNSTASSAQLAWLLKSSS